MRFTRGLETFGRLLRLPMWMIVFIFGLAAFIDRLALDPDSGQYSLLIWSGRLFIVGAILTEAAGIGSAASRWLGNRDRVQGQDS